VQIAVRTAKGRQTITLPAIVSRKELMDYIAKTFEVKVIGLRRGTDGVQSIELTDERIILKDRDSIIVVSPVEKTTESAISPANQTVAIEAGKVIVKNNESAPVVEDEIDQILSKTDGWTYIENSKRGYRSTDDYIAPWNIQNHPKWAYLKIKHIPFHAWAREKAYRSGSNTQAPLEADKFKIPLRKQLTGTDIAQSTVTINRQPYRHVDFVLFESAQVVEPIIGSWRSSGLQRCGYLIGKYIPDANIPLGITVQVAAIYEPPQLSSKTEAKLLKDPQSDKIDSLLSLLGLTRVGLIWTRLTVNESKELITDRDLSSPLEANELVRMSHLQTRYPNNWSNSSAGTFGSKFVSVLLASGKENTVEIEAYQMSNQGVALVRDKVIKPVKDDPKSFRIVQKEDFLYPDLLWRDKDEYGNVVTKADKVFPSHYFIIGVNHGFPKEPNPTFKTNTFPIENREKLGFESPNWNHVKRHLEGKHDTKFMEALNDFHLLLFLASQDFDVNFLREITSEIKQEKPDIQKIKKLQKDFHEALSKYTTSTPVSQEKDLVKELQNLIPGFSIQECKEALQVSNNDFGLAANYLLDQRK